MTEPTEERISRNRARIACLVGAALTAAATMRGDSSLKEVAQQLEHIARDVEELVLGEVD